MCWKKIDRRAEDGGGRARDAHDAHDVSMNIYCCICRSLPPYSRRSWACETGWQQRRRDGSRNADRTEGGGGDYIRAPAGRIRAEWESYASISPSETSHQSSPPTFARPSSSVPRCHPHPTPRPPAVASTFILHPNVGLRPDAPVPTAPTRLKL